MPLTPARCKNCGSFISADSSQKYIVCPYCRNKYLTKDAIKNFHNTSKPAPYEQSAAKAATDYVSSDFKIIGGILERYLGESTIVAVPGNVKEISSKAFSGLSQLTLVTLPEGLKTICDGAFKNCTSLSSIYIPLSVRTIGAHAFEGCSALTAINISDNVTEIGESAFRECTSLSLIHVMNGIHSLSHSIFEGCTSLTTVSIAEDVKTIGNRAFKDCTSLDCIYIPESVHTIEASAFRGCSSLSKIYVPGSIINIENNAFMDCTSLPILNLPDGIMNIGDSVFEGCTSLVSIRLPDSVASIGRNVFQDCRRLGNIIYSPDLLEILDRDTKWSGITCNPFEGSLMSNRFTDMNRCPRCGGKYAYIVKEKKGELSTDEADRSSLGGILKNAISKSQLIYKALDSKTDTHDESKGYYRCSYYKCKDCNYKKYTLN